MASKPRPHLPARFCSPGIVNVVCGESVFVRGAKQVVVLRDNLSCGPLPPMTDLQAWGAMRAEFWRGLDRIRVRGRRAALRDDLAGVLSADEIVLWLGTGLTDQMLFAWFPEALRLLGADRGRLRIVQLVNDVRGRELRHLGAVDVERVVSVPPARCLDAADIAEIESAWSALTSPEPGTLVTWLSRSPSRFPFLVRALRAIPSRYPDPVSGLGIHDMRLLRLVNEVGPGSAAVVAGAVHAAVESVDEPGDLWLFARLCRLGDATLRRPPVSLTGSGRSFRDTEVRLTPFGRDVLAGRANFVAANGIDDWVCGVHLCRSAEPDDTAGILIRRPNSGHRASRAIDV